MLHNTIYMDSAYSELAIYQFLVTSHCTWSMKHDRERKRGLTLHVPFPPDDVIQSNLVF